MSEQHSAHQDRNTGATLEDRQKLREQSKKRRSALVHTGSDTGASSRTATAADITAAPCSSDTLPEEPHAKRSKRTEDGAASAENDTRAATEADAPVAAASAAPKKKSVAEKMMESMGYKQGQGLGKSSTGRTEPVAAEQRPERAGLGTQAVSLEPANAGAAPAPRDWPLFFYEDDPRDGLTLRAPDANADAEPTGAELESWEIVSGAVPRAVMSTRFSRTSILYALQEARLEKLPALLRAVEANTPSMAAALPWLATTSQGMPAERHEQRLLKLGGQLTAAVPGLGVAAARRIVSIGGAAAAWMALGAAALADKEAPDSALVVLHTPKDAPFGPALMTEMGRRRTQGCTVTATPPLSPAVDLPPLLAEDGGASLVFTALSVGAEEEAVSGPGKGNAEMGDGMQALQLLQMSLNSCAAGGALVVRMGDMFTRHSVSVLYLLHRAFARCRVVKPFAASGLGAERFVLCLGRHRSVSGLAGHLARVLAAEAQARAKGHAVLSFVPMQRLLEPHFLRHVVNVNERLAVRERDTIAYLHSRCLGSGAAGRADEADGALRKQVEQAMADLAAGVAAAAAGGAAASVGGWTSGGVVERF